MTAISKERIEEIRERCKRATPPPWHYFPCGDKSNDCLLCVATDTDGNSPPAGHVSDDDVWPEGSKERKYYFDPEIADRINSANYNDFAFMAHARSDVPALLAALEASERRRGELEKLLDEASMVTREFGYEVLTDQIEAVLTKGGKDTA